MAPFNSNNGQFYDPVGSQSNQPQGYTYQQPTQQSAVSYPSSAPANYQTSQYGQYGNAYSNQQYATGRQDTGNNSAQQTAAAAALRTLGNQDYNQTRSTSGGTSSFGDSTWRNDGYNTNTYGQSTSQVQNRSDNSSASLYPSQNQPNTFARRSQPAQSSQNNTKTYSTSAYGTSANSGANIGYQASHQQQSSTQQPQPQRYSSPLHAVQAQQRQQQYGQQQSSHLPAVNQTNHQQRNSADQSPATVDPSQVYDWRAEQQKKAAIEAEKRRKREAEEAALKAELDRIEAEKKRVEEEARKFEEEKQRKEQAVKDAAAAKKAEKERKSAAAKERRQSKTAADALQKLATSGPNTNMAADAGPPANSEEAEMRAMFQRMREFNSKNPAMLAKLWEEERQVHASQSPPTVQQTPAPAPAARAAAPVVPSPQTAAPNKQPAAARVPDTNPSAPWQDFNGVNQPGGTAVQPPAKQQPGLIKQSMWPPHKKGALAESACKWLSALPMNKDKVVKNEDILKILERNPSYEQLCEGIEAIGLRFERSALARELLRIIPEAMKTAGGAGKGTNASQSPASGQKKGKSSAPRPAFNTASTVNYETPSFASLADAARAVNSMGKAGPAVTSPEPSPYFTSSTPAWQPTNMQQDRHPTPSQTRTPSQPPSNPQPRPPAVEFKVQSPPKPPANKEEAARKRTFGDLVDLTAGDSDDDEPPPKKMFAPPPVQKLPTVAGHSPSLPAAPDSKDFWKNRVSASVGPPRPAPGLTPQVAERPLNKPKGPNQEYLQIQRMKGVMLVEPIMRDRVARKSTYDSRTIARDVLLATGRHPDMRPLNDHLQYLSKTLGNQGGSYDSDGSKGNRSDLATIRWDIIDPEPKFEAVKRPELALPSDANNRPASSPLGPPSQSRAFLRTDENGHAVVDYAKNTQDPTLSAQFSSKPKPGRPRHSSTLR